MNEKEGGGVFNVLSRWPFVVAEDEVEVVEGKGGGEGNVCRNWAQSSSSSSSSSLS